MLAVAPVGDGDGFAGRLRTSQIGPGLGVELECAGEQVEARALLAALDETEFHGRAIGRQAEAANVAVAKIPLQSVAGKGGAIVGIYQAPGRCRAGEGEPAIVEPAQRGHRVVARRNLRRRSGAIDSPSADEFVTECVAVGPRTVEAGAIGRPGHDTQATGPSRRPAELGHLLQVTSGEHQHEG